MFSRTIPCLAAAIAAVVLFQVPAASQGTFATIRAEHFTVRYMQGVPEPEAQRVLALLQEDYDTLTSQLGLELKSPLEVRMYDSPSRYKSEIKMGKDVPPAMYVRGTLHVLEPVPAGALDVALRYQFALGLLGQTAQYSCPVWLREAFAVYHSGRMPDLSSPGSVTLASFSDLSQELEEAQTPVERNDVDFVLGRTMEFFVQKYGERKAYGVFKEFAVTPTVEKVFKKVFEEEFPDIEKAWSKFVAVKPRKAK